MRLRHHDHPGQRHRLCQFSDHVPRGSHRLRLYRPVHVSLERDTFGATPLTNFSLTVTPTNCGNFNVSVYVEGHCDINPNQILTANAGASYSTMETTPPTILCPTGRVFCVGQSVLPPTSVSDNCGVVSVTPTNVVASGTGTNTQMWTVTDRCGNTAQCTETYIVDMTPPTITCPANVQQCAAPGTTTAVVNYPAPTASDNCPGVTTSCTPSSGSTFSGGVTPVTCTASDTAGNTNTCTFDVAVVTVTISPPSGWETCAGSSNLFSATVNPAGGSYSWSSLVGGGTTPNGSNTVIVFQDAHAGSNRVVSVDYTFGAATCQATSTGVVFRLTVSPATFGPTCVAETNVFWAEAFPEGGTFGWNPSFTNMTTPDGLKSTNWAGFGSAGTNVLTVTYGPCTRTSTGIVVAVTNVVPALTNICAGLSMGYSVGIEPPGQTFPHDPAWTVSPANAGIMSPATGVGSTFVSSNTFRGQAVITAHCGGSAASATVTVYEVQSVIWKDLYPNQLDDNPNPGGGWRIFPDKQSPNDTANRRTVGLEAQVEPPLTNVTVHFTSFDVDDPWTNSGPIDTDFFMLGDEDNRGSVNGKRAGELTFASANTDTSGRATNILTVTMQPGDNFRVVASCDPNFASQYEAKTPSDLGNIVKKVVGGVIPGFYVTDMLTVWRRLWVERDSLQALTSNQKYYQLSVLGWIDKSKVAVPTNWWFEASGVIWGSGVPGEDEFEGGTARFILTNPSAGTTNTFTKSVLKSRVTGILGTRAKIAVWPPFTSAETNLIISAPIAQFRMWDDDDFSVFDSPHRLDGGHVLSDSLAEAYIKPIYADEPSQGNSRTNRPFIRRLTYWQAWYAINDTQDIISSPSNWATLQLAAFEPDDNLTAPALFTCGTDLDSDSFFDLQSVIPPSLHSELAPIGPGGSCDIKYGQTQFSGANASAVFLEILREDPGIDEKHTMTHELGHTGLGLVLHLNSNQLMGPPSFYQTSTSFTLDHLKLLRSTTTW